MLGPGEEVRSEGKSCRRLEAYLANAGPLPSPLYAILVALGGLQGEVREAEVFDAGKLELSGVAVQTRRTRTRAGGSARDKASTKLLMNRRGFASKQRIE